MPDPRTRQPVAPALPAGEPVYARDAELIKTCLAGDDEAWTLLIRRYHEYIYSIPRRYGLNEDDAADVYQNVCVALWKGLSTLRSERALTRWIESTAVRMSGRLARKRRNEAHEPDLVLANRADDGVSAADEMTRLEEEHRARRALDELPEGCGRLLKLLYLSDPPPSYDDLARELGIPRGSLGPTRARCVEKLRRILRKRR